ncbi:MAG: DUF1614 domain-containing protein [Firmicutes bacterium]|nr:DUF1614 domain-containing protein [Bacillota bacterium]
MPLGLILLLVTAGLVYFGLAQRVLDRMNLTDSQAFIFIGLIIAGSFVDIPISRGPVAISVNVGGAVIPLVLVFWLISRADSAVEKWRGLVAGVATGIVIWGFAQLVGYREPAEQWLDPIWSYSLIAGIAGYLAGRSRRSAFIAGTLGIMVSDLIHMGIALAKGMATTVAIGGAGAFDATILAGLVAVILAEVIGESRERLGGGPVHDETRPKALDNEEFLIHEFDGEGQDKQEEPPIDVGALGITGEDLALPSDAGTSRRQHILRVEETGELATWGPADYVDPAIANAAGEEEGTDDR